MATNIYDQLKELMRAKVDDIAINELDDISQISENLNIEEDALKSAFNEITTARNTLFSEIETLITSRTEAYQTVITILYLSYFFNEVKSSIENEITIWYTLLQFSKSKEFSDVLRNLKSYVSISGNMTPTKTAQFQDYFQDKFDELLSLSGRDIQMIQTTAGPDIQEDIGSGYVDIDKDDPDDAANFLFYTLGYLATAEGTFFSFSAIMPVINIIEISERNLASVTFSTLDEEIKKARNNLKRFMILDIHRKENDSSYTGIYTQDIYDKIELYDYYLSRFAGMDQKTMEALHADGTFNLLFLTKEDIDSEIDALSYETIQTIDSINMFLENYAMFVKLPEDSIDQLENTITGLLVNYEENLSEETDKEYFIDADSDENVLMDQPDLATFILDLEELSNLDDEAILFFKDYYNLIILYTGLKLKDYSSSYALNYINYAIKNLVTKTEIHRDEIDAVTFIDLKKLEESLVDKYEIHVRDIVNNELIDPTIKLIYPKLALLDLVDITLLIENNIGYNDAQFTPSVDEDTLYYRISDDTWRKYSDSGSGYVWAEYTPNTLTDLDLIDLTNLINTIYISVLEAILEKRASINDIFMKTLRAYAQRGYNFKSVFIEMIIRKAFTTITTYAGGENTVLDDAVISAIENYLSSDIDTTNEKILHEYKTVRSAFYAAEENLIDTILVDGNVLRTYLKTFYE